MVTTMIDTIPSNPTVVNNVSIRLGDVELRSLKESDILLVQTWRNKSRVRCGFFDSSEVTKEKHRAWWDYYVASTTDRSFIIACQGDYVGFISLYNIDYLNSKAEIGRMMIGEDVFLGRGIMPKAIDAIVGYARTLGIQSIYLNVKLENFSAIKCYNKAGFIRSTSDRTSIHMTRSTKE